MAKGSCGHETDRLYRVGKHEWVCGDCALEKYEYVTLGHLEEWTDKQLKQEGIMR